MKFLLLVFLAQSLPTLPPYEGPEAALDRAGVPGGTLRVQGSTTCYDEAAQLRLTLHLRLVQPLSDDRAGLAWQRGLLAGQGGAAQAFDAEHLARLTAEARAHEAEARQATTEALLAQVSAPDPWWQQVLVPAGWLAVGLAAGVVIWGVTP